MKNTTKTLALLLAVLAMGNSAQAQTQLQASKPYTFKGTPATTGGGAVTYQWYREGQPIPGATNADYILPDHLGYGTNVMFKRGAVSSTCPGKVTYTNNVNVSFGMVVGSVNWASVNVSAYQTFASRPDMYTQFYQWNRTTAWAATGSSVSNWSSATITDTWTINPCPTGWRLPTNVECTALVNTGSTWAEANTRGNVVAGRFFGVNNASCTLPNNMYGCLFIPAVGFRDINSGPLVSQGIDGYYWSSTEYSSNIYGYNLRFNNASAILNNYSRKTNGFSIRCVQSVQ